MNKRSLGKLLVLTPIFAGTVLSFNNCSLNGFQAFDQSSLSQSPATSISVPQSAFAQQKVQVTVPVTVKTASSTTSSTSSSSSYVQAQGVDQIDSSLSLVVVVDNSCIAAKNTTLQALVKKYLSVQDPTLPLQKQAYRATTLSGVTAQSLEAFAQTESCLIGITNIVQYKTAFTNDSSIGDQEYYKNINAEVAYKGTLGTTVKAANKARVAVIDTGVEITHPDLVANIAKNGNKVVGWDFVNSSSTIVDENGHGTHVAGLIAATTNNKEGISGVCFNNCEIMPFRILNAKGEGDNRSIFNAVQMAVENGADVINMSLGYGMDIFAFNKPLEVEIIRQALSHNVVIVVAAGNDSAELGYLEGTTLKWPALFGQLQGFITVASFNAKNDAISEFSNYSRTYVDIASPGSYYFSRAEGVNQGILSTFIGGGYKRLSGTSMASPVVAGVVGNIIAHFKEANIPYTSASVESFLTQNSTAKSDYVDKVRDGKRLDLAKIEQALATQNVPSIAVNKDPLVDFVDALYSIILKRSGDAASLAELSQRIKDHSISVEGLFTTFFESDEFIKMSGFDTRKKTNETSISLNASYFISSYYIPTLYYLMYGKVMEDNYYYKGRTVGESVTWYGKLFDQEHFSARGCIRFLLSDPLVQDHISKTPLAGLALFDGSAPVASANQNDTDLRTTVTAMYAEILQRAPDQAGLDQFVAQLKAGTKTVQQIRDILINSDEKYILDLYVAILGRKADATGIDYFSKKVIELTPQVGQTMARQWVKDRLTQACANHENGECSPSVAVSDVVSVDYSAIVEALYKEILGRASDAAGKSYYIGRLKAGATQSQVRQEMSQSDEGIIVAAYRTQLHKEPDQDGVKYWLSAYAQWKAASGSAAAQAKILAEFAAICANHTNGACPGSGTQSSTPASTPVQTSTPVSTVVDYGAIVESLYKEILGRASDAAGKSYFVGRLKAGATQNQVRQEMTQSDEGIIVAAYRTQLHKEPDQEGVKYWLGVYAQWKAASGAAGAQAKLISEFASICANHTGGACR